MRLYLGGSFAPTIPHSIAGEKQRRCSGTSNMDAQTKPVTEVWALEASSLRSMCTYGSLVVPSQGQSLSGSGWSRQSCRGSQGYKMVATRAKNLALKKALTNKL